MSNIIINICENDILSGSYQEEITEILLLVTKMDISELTWVEGIRNDCWILKYIDDRIYFMYDPSGISTEAGCETITLPIEFCGEKIINIVVKLNDCHKPYVKLKWDNINGSTNIRTCDQLTCSYDIFVEIFDVKNDITSVEIFKKIDDGSWVLFTDNVINATFRDSVTNGTNSYKAVVKDAAGTIVESNILQYKGNQINIINPGNVVQTIYRRDNRSQGMGQTKIKNLQAVTYDGSIITKIEVRCRFRRIYDNVWSDIKETLNLTPGSDSVTINHQWVYPFHVDEYYMGVNWSGGDNSFCEVRIYTSLGGVQIFSPPYSNEWYYDYPDSIIL